VFELVIFDCDGVLIDSERIAVKVDAEILREVGWQLTEAEIIERFMGRSDAYMRGEIEAAIGRPLGEDWGAALRPRFRAAMEAELEPVEGIVDALDRITLPACVASSSTHDHLQFALGLTGLLDRFDGRIFSATDVEHGKPAPDLFLHAAATLGVPPDRCAVVEDSRYGIEAARAAGMRAFGYAGGLTPRDRLAGPATTVFDHMHELPDLIAAG
jgi:HAD superfamily hydrolase (TIGR01509 family)